MKGHIEESGINFKKRRLLISGLKAKEILLSTALLKWYLTHGLRIVKVHHVLEFVPKRPFREFVREITEKRKEGSRDANKAVLAQTYKLIGNSSYGSMLIDKMKYAKTSIIRGDQTAKKCVNSPLFKELNVLGEDLYELQEGYKSLSMTIPIYLGYQILQLAKLRMLEFAYDFMLKYIERPLFQYLYCDTDSLYFSFSRESLDECVKPHMREEYDYQMSQCCCADRFPTAFLSRTCCPFHKFEDDKEPGLLKIEFHKGDIFLGLSSKTYVCKSDKDGLKLSCKGVNKSTILRGGSVVDMFKETLADRKSREAVNSGIRSHNGAVKSYKQRKDAFTYLYVKREVCAGGVYTKPLNVRLWPVPCNLLPLQAYPELCMDFVFPFSYFNRRFTTLYQAMTYFKIMDVVKEVGKRESLLEKIMAAKGAELREIYKCACTGQMWESVKYFRVKDIALHRVRQIPKVRQSLEATAPKRLVNAEKNDSEWGAGEEWRVIRWIKENDVPGRNYLGLAYEEIRREIK